MEYHSGGSLPLLGRPRYCPGANANGGYLCETGHCCGETGCCTYYYELWWFWLLWTVLILFSCCCAYRHRRAKLRVQQQQRQREISLLAYQGASSYPSSMLDLSFLASLKLPSYEEVAAQPSTPPPPYSSVFTTPRYPQPPRTVNPHLLTQHGPLLHHHPLSDGPSSLSSDNSSSCSCDSCCPSSPCSSSLSAPITYETDTSHASTPSEVAPLARDATLETISAAASCLEADEMPSGTERIVDMETPEAKLAMDPAVPDTVTVAVVTRVASPQPPPSSSPEMVLTVGTASPVMQQLDLVPTTTKISSSSSLTPSSPTLVDTKVPSTLIIGTCGPNEGPITSPVPKCTPSPSTPIASTSKNQTLESLNLTRTDKTNVTSSPTSRPSPDAGRAIVPTPETLPILSNPILSPDPAHSKPTLGPDSNLILTPEPLSSNFTPTPLPGPSNITLDLESISSSLAQISVPGPSVLIQDLETSDPVIANKLASCSPTSSPYQTPALFPSSGLTMGPPSPASDLSSHPIAVAGLVSGLDLPACPSLVLTTSSQLDLANLSIQPGFSGSGPCCGVVSSPLSSPGGSVSTPQLPAPTTSSFPCPAIMVNLESLSSPEARSSSSPLPSPPSPTSTSLLAPVLLLDPLTALHQSDRGTTSASSGHASSLSPSPRATQSPPKQTLFSPCVDIFEPGPPSWGEDEEEDQEEENNNDDDEEDDVGADESQYRHRRLTGDSGIEVCRCRVEEEDEEEEDRKDDSKDGGERDKIGSGITNLHDSVDCPGRSQATTGEGLALCNPTSTTMLSSEDCRDVVIVMETA
ncbi:uncharacterized protein LOC143010706 [Genypterus blacodes]|uniref:uncharacterized protein LOC143010706 n=1 Tax=Genypterus blacodes TaxID=154954 RepID=UPI003F775996